MKLRRVSMFVCSLAFISPAGADDPSAYELVRQGNHHLQQGEYDLAIDKYVQAHELVPDSPEVSYDKAVAHYRMGEFDSARELFLKSLATRELELESKAKYNLGNCAYASALSKLDDVPEAISDLQSAIAHYKDAISANPADVDARANIEMAQLFMKDLLDNQKQEQQQQENQQQDRQERDREEKQEQDQQNQDGQQEEQSQDQQDPQNSEKDSEQEQDQQQQQQDESGEEQDQDSQPAGGAEQQQEQSVQEAQESQEPPQSAERRPMTREEAQKLLQLIRDKELQRRQELARRQRVRHLSVDKDW